MWIGELANYSHLYVFEFLCTMLKKHQNYIQNPNNAFSYGMLMESSGIACGIPLPTR